jgi:hypothetical protein
MRNKNSAPVKGFKDPGAARREAFSSILSRSLHPSWSQISVVISVSAIWA